jgi:hypothetical protein
MEIPSVLISDTNGSLALDLFKIEIDNLLFRQALLMKSQKQDADYSGFR